MTSSPFTFVLYLSHTRSTETIEKRGIDHVHTYMKPCFTTAYGLGGVTGGTVTVEVLQQK